MADIICPKCREPWDGFGIRNDMDIPVAWPFPETAEAAEEQVRANWGPTAPPEIVELGIDLARAEADFLATRGLDDEHPTVVAREQAMKRARDELGKVVYATGLAKGCPACWEDPSRIPTDPDQQNENLRAALFDGAWDGDPAEFFA